MTKSPSSGNRPQNRPASPEDQHKRFVDTARELGCDEDEAAFDEKLRRIASVKPATTKPPRAKRIVKAKPAPPPHATKEP